MLVSWSLTSLFSTNTAISETIMEVYNYLYNSEQPIKIALTLISTSLSTLLSSS